MWMVLKKIDDLNDNINVCFLILVCWFNFLLLRYNKLNGIIGLNVG